jgi:hypothetical protein
MTASPVVTPPLAETDDQLSASHEAVRRSLFRPFPAPTPADRWRVGAGEESIADVRVWLSRLDAESFYRLAVAIHGEEWRRRRACDLGIVGDRLAPVPERQPDETREVAAKAPSFRLRRLP